jgi:hypothetical protein
MMPRARRRGGSARRKPIWAAVGVLRAWIERYGVPQALYTDWKNVYVRPPNQMERVTGAEPLTQFERMCATLASRSSWPARRRRRAASNAITERSRIALVKKLRRHGIADLETANGFLETTYWTDHNERVAQGPRRPTTFTSRAPGDSGGTRSFGWKKCAPCRTTGWCGTTIACCSSSGTAGQAPARSTVMVCEDAAPIAPPVAPSLPRPRVAVDHPWRQGFKQMGRDRPYWQLVDR